MINKLKTAHRMIPVFLVSLLLVFGSLGQTVKAAPAGSYTVAFDPNDDVTEYPAFRKITVAAGGKISQNQVPPAPTRKGYVFGGWYYAENADGSVRFWDFGSDTVKENTTLWAFWQHSVIFDPDDGVAEYADFHKIQVTPGQKIPKDKLPANPVREGYVFAGWYYAEDADEKPVFWKYDTDVVKENTTLWASWKAAESSAKTEAPAARDRDEVPKTDDNSTLWYFYIGLFGVALIAGGVVLTSALGKKERGRG